VEVSKAHLFRNADVTGLAVALTDARAALERAFALYEPALVEQKFRVPQIPVVNLPIWEFGHVAWFQERWLGRNSERHLGVGCSPKAALSTSMFDGADELFDSSAVNHGTRWALSLPDSDTTKQYAATVLEQSLALLKKEADTRDSHYLFWLCAAHEFMHAEAFSYMANTLGLSGSARFRKQSLIDTRLIQGIEGSPLRLNRFGFDNESFDQFSEAELQSALAIDLDRLPVTWQMLSEFRASPNYHDEKYWRGQNKVWQKAIPIDVDNAESAAAHVSYWEALAWCRWRGRALPSEAQWLAAIAADNLPWGQVWEWTSTEFKPFNGFVAHPYEDYSQPWFKKGLQVLKGGSIYTSAHMKHPQYRNFFLPDRDDVCTGFRSCKPVAN
jgi:gamma-glutamyl hercynylcysteine S-oxide synthase